MSSIIVYVTDTETVGKDPGPNRLVELGVAPLLVPDVENPCAATVVEDEIFESYVKPGERITFGAMATHGIREATVENAPSLEDVLRASPLLRDGRHPMLIAAHNAPFDQSFVEDHIIELLPAPAEGTELKRPYWLDTLRLAKHVFKDAEGYSNQSLRYELDLQHPLLVEGGAHRAGSDALVTALLLSRLLQEHSLRDLCRLQNEPIHLTKMAMGKHRGMAFSELPEDYCRWILRSDLDDDVKFSARMEIERRRAA